VAEAKRPVRQSRRRGGKMAVISTKMEAITAKLGDDEDFWGGKLRLSEFCATSRFTRQQ